jgi:ABC-type amino acid transport system permease subunit
VSVQLASSHPFPLSGAAFPLANVVTLSRRVTLPFDWANMSSLPLLHLPIILCPVVSPLKVKLKHWIHSTVVAYSLWTIWLSLSTAIKRSSISTLVTLLITQTHLYFVSSLAKLKHHVIRAIPTAVVLFYCCLILIIPPHNDTYGNKVVDPLSLTEQLIDMWIHVKKYFEMS